MERGLTNPPPVPTDPWQVPPGPTGKGVRIAVVDSGVNPQHSHVGKVVGCWRLTSYPGGERIWDVDPSDKLGHGTAVVGIIKQKCPEAEIYCLKVFGHDLAAGVDDLIAGIERAATLGVHLINLSLGTANPRYILPLGSACVKAAAKGATIVATGAAKGAESLYPAHFEGEIPGLIAVGADPDCPPHAYRVVEGRFLAHPWPRPLPGRPQTKNLMGPSFATAHMTAHAARWLSAHPGTGAREARAGLLAATSGSG